MKLILSRKGFDSASGGGPSPIVGGVPISLPIPDSKGYSRTSYAMLGLGEHVAKASRGRLGARDLCHHDPVFTAQGRAMLGQCGAAQSHLAGQGVGAGDLFLFCGLFQEEGQQKKRGPHHRIFAWLRVEEVLDLTCCDAQRLEQLRRQSFPHALGLHASNDHVYIGTGAAARQASPDLRLTVEEGPPSLWHLPSFFAETGLSYHGKPARWLPGGRLQSVARGQEFVADIGEREDALEWTETIIRQIEA